MTVLLALQRAADEGAGLAHDLAWVTAALFALWFGTAFVRAVWRDKHWYRTARRQARTYAERDTRTALQEWRSR